MRPATDGMLGNDTTQGLNGESKDIGCHSGGLCCCNYVNCTVIWGEGWEWWWRRHRG